MESCPTQAVLPLVGLAAEKVIRDRYNKTNFGFEQSPKSTRAIVEHQASRTPGDEIQNPRYNSIIAYFNATFRSRGNGWVHPNVLVALARANTLPTPLSRDPEAWQVVAQP
ncbi:MAG: hypothetical protein ACQESR_06395 [Planctomycetota bacterium]